MFPNIVSKDLTGREFTIPSDLEGEYNIVLIVFDQWQQRDVYPWLPLLQQIEQKHPNVRYYELPVVPDYAPPQRFMLDQIMRAGIPDRETRQRTITLYVDQIAFCKTVGLPDMSTIHTLLLDKSGNVLWQAAGAYSKLLGDALLHTVVALSAT